MELVRRNVSSRTFIRESIVRDKGLYEYWERKTNLGREADHCFNNAPIFK